MKTIERKELEFRVSFSEAEETLIKILRAFGDIAEIVPLGEEWKSGTIILKPGNAGLKEKQIPLKHFL